MTSKVQRDWGRNAPRGRPRGAPGPSAAEDGSLDELRELLLGDELSELAEVRSRLEHERLAVAVSAVLPDAIEDRTRTDERLSEALTPTIENAMRASVRKDPHVLVDALFPVMGPAIRKAVAAAIGEMVQALNRSLENSFSIQGLRWRLEAMRSGRPYAEVVLLHSLVFRVEQVFLIHSETGLLLQHVVASDLEAPDGDLVSGMLTAIQDFVRDSLGAANEDALDSLRVGALTIWIERGPRATIAGVLRGEAPKELRRTFQDALGTVHLERARELDEFVGDAAPFEACRPTLERCFQSRYDTGDTKPSPTLLVVASALALLVVAVGAAMLWHRHLWNRYLADLRATPGVVVTSSRIGWLKYEVTGLRDPYAKDPTSLLAGAGIDPSDVDARWEPYASYASELVPARAAGVLAPPATVALTADGGTLHVAGLAPHAWIETARHIALVIPGVTGLETSKLRDIDEINAKLESTLIRFESNTSELSPGQDAPVGALAGQLRELQSTPEWHEAAPRFEIVGHTDSTGSESTNARLSEERAARVIELLRTAGVDVSGFAYRGVSTAEPVREEKTAEDAAFNRSVTLRVVAERQPGAEPTTP